ncbi:TetR family transcriptional regulator [Arthrobacter sp. I2-34]|uniref:TetR family transcriptional regulator n=1 Tax=Arthrobacter hankyongi TaxID=2904801 RepID=A0ABS9L7F5_9MICC|nr:TetR family transcriptional regulator [Arthrobacter hankyongi]MCG2622598.1 TetR family transcriptional regulator [Arthrobacter hankyongi]
MSRSEGTRTALLEAVLKVAAAHGVRGVTHRRVASAAGISLGSTSYHFASLDDMLLEAFRYFAERESGKYSRLFESAESMEDLIEAALAVVRVQHSDVTGATLLYELYAQGVRDPRYRSIVQQWSRSATAQVERLCAHEVAVRFEVIWEGLTFQRLLGDSSLSDRQARDFLRTALN